MSEFKIEGKNGQEIYNQLSSKAQNIIKNYFEAKTREDQLAIIRDNRALISRFQYHNSTSQNALNLGSNIEKETWAARANELNAIAELFARELEVLDRHDTDSQKTTIQIKSRLIIKLEKKCLLTSPLYVDEIKLLSEKFKTPEEIAGPSFSRPPLRRTPKVTEGNSSELGEYISKKAQDAPKEGGVSIKDSFRSGLAALTSCFRWTYKQKYDAANELSKVVNSQKQGDERLKELEDFFNLPNLNALKQGKLGKIAKDNLTNLKSELEKIKITCLCS